MEPEETANPKLIIFIGISLAIMGIVILFQVNKTSDWKAGKGKIIQSEIVSGSEEFDVEVKYEYLAEGEKYIGHKISSADAAPMGYDAAKAVIDKYYVGREVSVYYNVDKPSKAILEKGILPQDYLTLILGLFLIFFGVRSLHKKAALEG